MKYSLFISVFLIEFIFSSCHENTGFYKFNDYGKVAKTDVHLHINSLDKRYMDMAAENNFRVISPNVDSRIPVDEQLATASRIKKEWPGRFTFFGTFSVDSFGTKDFEDRTIAWIGKCMNEGASGIKIWKNIGMVLKDNSGKYVMADDPAFDRIFNYLEEKKIPVVGHLGEPKNCWLPFSEMTDSSNARYYRSNPQYHMFLHPEAPSYEDQINAMDNLLKKHPALDYTGAHLASMEWNIDEVAKRMDKFPGFKIDLSARMGHVQLQSIKDREKVRNFMIRYQDRILYGTDITVNANESNPDARSSQITDRWKSNWIYLATDSTQMISNIQEPVRGLMLPKATINKIFNDNAERFFSKN